MLYVSSSFLVLLAQSPVQVEQPLQTKKYSGKLQSTMLALYVLEVKTMTAVIAKAAKSSVSNRPVAAKVGNSPFSQARPQGIR